MAQTCAIGGRCRNGTGFALAKAVTQAVAHVKVFVFHAIKIPRYKNREGFSTRHLFRPSRNKDDDDPEPPRVTFVCPQERDDLVRVA
jgi:hypothetical protein